MENENKEENENENLKEDDKEKGDTKLNEKTNPKVEREKTFTADKKRNTRKSTLKMRNTLLEKNVDFLFCLDL